MENFTNCNAKSQSIFKNKTNKQKNRNFITQNTLFDEFFFYVLNKSLLKGTKAYECLLINEKIAGPKLKYNFS